jgi:stearoyl-CoA desaturase (delta-9 desaturase)
MYVMHRSPSRLRDASLLESGSFNWPTAIVVAVFHVGAVAALFTFSWKVFLETALLYCLTAGLGMTLGYHRLLTHRAFKTHLWVEYLLVVFGTWNMHGGPIFWAATHRMHHRSADQPGDPHSPHDGAFWSQMGWYLWGESSYHSEARTMLLSKYAPDLAKHRFYVWLNRWSWVPLALLGFALYAVGGAALFFWGFFLRVVFGLHVMGLVNSAAHIAGRRSFETRDRSGNLWWLALLSFGEGWHNNHHAYPSSARLGLAWYEFDSVWLFLRLMEKCGLAWDLKTPRLGAPSARENRLDQACEVVCEG